MKRRSFIRNISLGAAATIGVPYLLPTGRLFAATGSRVADHVVFCLFAGGVRNLESVGHELNGHGNLMPRTLNGDITNLDGIKLINESSINGLTPLQEKGTLYKEFKYEQGSTSHYEAHAAAMTGIYPGGVNINTHPQHPTIFELYRKHNSPTMPAKNAWWVSDSEGQYANLNYSSHPEYGANYGANYIRPSSFTAQLGYDSLGNPKDLSDVEVVEKIQLIRDFCDANFSSQYNGVANSIIHDEVEKIEIERFIQDCMDEARYYNSGVPDGWDWDLPAQSFGERSFNGDMNAVHFAEKIITKFQPELLVVNMHTADIAHTDFTRYANNLHKMDYALAHLWDAIEANPKMSGNTILIAMPEHGRNLDGNGIRDDYEREALDHNNDIGSKEIFALVVGPNGVVAQDQVFSQEKGESIDIVPTIAHILDFHKDIPGGLDGEVLMDSFY